MSKYVMTKAATWKEARRYAREGLDLQGKVKLLEKQYEAALDVISNFYPCEDCPMEETCHGKRGACASWWAIHFEGEGEKK